MSLNNDDRRSQAYLAFLGGKTYKTISSELNIHPQTAARWIKDYQDELQSLNLATIRDEQAAELDRLNHYTDVLEQVLRTSCDDAVDPETGKIYRDGVKSTVSIIQALLRVSQQRVALRGLDTVVQVAKTEAIELSQMDIADLDQGAVIDLITSYVRRDA